MARNNCAERRESSIRRDAFVHKLHDAIKTELGELYQEVSRGYIYDRIHKETGLCTKTIATILNHRPPEPSREEE